jgi:hypothetical protein
VLNAGWQFESRQVVHEELDGEMHDKAHWETVQLASASTHVAHAVVSPVASMQSSAAGSLSETVA